MKNIPDMTPVCEKCGAIAPIDAEMSTKNWTVYRVKVPCVCGGKYISRYLLETAQEGAEHDGN